MSATNEDMARVMGWERQFSDPINKHVYLYNDQWLPIHLIPFSPIDNLNHTRLVEERIAALGLIAPYMQALTKLLKDERGRSSAWGFAHAPAQTRCNAAWAAYSAWKEQTK